MIKSIKIEGFQSHKDTYLEFHKGVNIIVGNSDSGKTAILRAISWIVKNRPSGDTFISTWANEVCVEIKIENHSIIRRKGKNINNYILNTLEFTAMGMEVPKEIQDALNIKEINISNQLDAPFLLSETPGQVASHFNKVARLSKIDTGTSNVNSWITKLKSDIEKDVVDIEKFTEQLKGFEYLEKFEVDVEVLEYQVTRLTTLRSKNTKLSNLIETYNNNAEEILCYQDTLALEEPINGLLTLKTNRKELNIKAYKLEHVLENYYLNIAVIEQESIMITLEPSITSLLTLYTERNTQNNQRISLFKAITGIKNSKIQINTANQNYNTLHNKFEEEMGDVCFLCGTKLK